jgi:TDG/mug DNA glycosylase family protein
MMDVLGDLHRGGLSIIFCGTAVGDQSARLGAYYAGPGNKFWRTLHATGLTPDLLKPTDWRRLTEHGLGLTDLAKTVSGMDKILKRHDFDRDRLRQNILDWQPKVLAFNGKRAGQEFLERPVQYGQQPETIGTTALWVLPSTSGAASGHWSEEPWKLLAASVQNGRG